MTRPALTIVYRDPRRLRPYEKNARTHSPEQRQQIRASMREFGFTNPILLRDNDESIGAGHGRWETVMDMIAAGETLPTPDGKTVPTITLHGLTDDQWRAYILADNKIAQNAGWDLDLLKSELGDLRGIGFDLDLTGFAAGDLSSIFLEREHGENDPYQEWQGMPEFQQEDKRAFRSLALHFPDQDAVDAFAKLIGQVITEKTRFVWYPQIEIETYADKRYSAS